jgi:hypothetical protein
MIRGHDPVQDDRSDFTQPCPLLGDTGPNVLRTPVLLSEALLAHDVYMCLERPSGALPPEMMS